MALDNSGFEIETLDDELGYDADHNDSSQYCKHGTFIGSWWGPDYLCYYCESGISDEELAAEAAYYGAHCGILTTTLTVDDRTSNCLPRHQVWKREIPRDWATWDGTQFVSITHTWKSYDDLAKER